MVRHVKAGVFLALLLVSSAAQAADAGQVGDARAGRGFAIRSCADCHDVKSLEQGQPAKGKAPNFYAVAQAKSSTAIGLSVFLMTPHATMPNLIISERDRHNVIAYIMSLRDKKN